MSTEIFPSGYPWWATFNRRDRILVFVLSIQKILFNRFYCIICIYFARTRARFKPSLQTQHYGPGRRNRVADHYNIVAYIVIIAYSSPIYVQVQYYLCIVNCTYRALFAWHATYAPIQLFVGFRQNVRLSVSGRNLCPMFIFSRPNLVRI